MHSICCVSTIGVTNSSSFADALDLAMEGSVGDDHPNLWTNSNNGFRSRRSSGGGSGDQARLGHRIGVENQIGFGDVKINEIVGNGISGVLNKWVNYGKGWRPRWFVLQDGVLSYYKIHGPDKIVVSEETEKGSKVIGEESLRRIRRHKNGRVQMRRIPVGEVHLKVSSIRESRSDDKRFSIFTGTKRLHLRAETREDRAAWMEALQRAKDMFPRISNSELMAPVDDYVISTEKLRMRLLDEGVDERAIQEAEEIMRTEFSSFQNQLVILKQKQMLLVDTLRQLEVHIMMRRKHLETRIQNASSNS